MSTIPTYPTRFQKLRWKMRGHVPFSNWWIVWRKLDRSASSILDLGCGVGSPMKFLNRHKRFHVVGVDGFKPYLDRCLREGTYDMVLHEDVRNLPFQDKTFDVVMALQVLEHLDLQDGKALLLDMERIARKQVIVSTDVNEYVQGAVDGNDYQIHRHIWDIKELRGRGFETHGLSFKGYGGETGCARHLPGFPRWLIATALQPIVGLLVYYCPRYAGAVVCTKNMEEPADEKQSRTDKPRPAAETHTV